MLLIPALVPCGCVSRASPACDIFFITCTASLCPISLLFGTIGVVSRPGVSLWWWIRCSQPPAQTKAVFVVIFDNWGELRSANSLTGRCGKASDVISTKPDHTNLARVQALVTAKFSICYGGPQGKPAANGAETRGSKLCLQSLVPVFLIGHRFFFWSQSSCVS